MASKKAIVSNVRKTCKNAFITLYIQKTYVINENMIWQEDDKSKGILISKDAIETIEFLAERRIIMRDANKPNPNQNFGYQPTKEQREYQPKEPVSTEPPNKGTNVHTPNEK